MGSLRVGHNWATSLSLFSFMHWRRKWQPTPVLLPGKSHGRRSLVGCSPWGLKGSDTTERLHFHFSVSRIGEGNGDPLQCSCLENPRDRGAWWAAVSRVAQSRTQLKWLSSSSSSSSRDSKKDGRNPTVTKSHLLLRVLSTLIDTFIFGNKCGTKLFKNIYFNIWSHILISGGNLIVVISKRLKFTKTNA